MTPSSSDVESDLLVCEVETTPIWQHPIYRTIFINALMQSFDRNYQVCFNVLNTYKPRQCQLATLQLPAFILAKALANN